VHDYFLGDQRIATRPQGQSTRYVLADQVGSTRALVDSATGSVVKRLDYFPFGETRTDTGAAVCTERFDGKYRDASGQDQFAARHYAPPRGVFLQPDTVTSDVYDPQALNRYAFPGNNPATLSDPTGHEWESDRPVVACCIEITVTPTDWWVSFEDFDFMNPSFGVALSQAEQFRADFDKMYARDGLDLRLEEPAGPEFHPPDIPSAPASGGFPISTYHGAPDLPVQDMGLGPLEYISEVKAAWSVGVRVVTGAALKVAARRAAVAAGRNAVRGGAAAVRLGQAGEAAVRAAHDIGPATRILVNGVERIPDGLNLTKGVLSEVKNVGSLSYTRQLRDYATYAARNGLRFDLYVRRSTVLSGPLQEAIESGAIHVNYIK
jgi:RHS repeat-associated protein